MPNHTNELKAGNTKIAVVGLGYVGLPLAVAFAERYPTCGFDINEARINELKNCKDHTLEIDETTLGNVIVKEHRTIVRKISSQMPAHVFEENSIEKEFPREEEDTVSWNGLYCTSRLEEIAECNVFIITVPTPVDRYNRPDLNPLYKASESVGKVLKRGDVVVYESTVYPGVTEEECVPVLERVSGLKFNQDFFAGYSPERINPGDKEHTVTRILKVTSGSTPETADFVDALYASVITAGTFKASTIRVAEAAKVIENSQRDINIAFVNELSKIFSRMGIDTHDVLAAAGTKWNFLKFQPGLVGGHCIGVDPYYLAQKAQEVGYHPEIILAGRRLNDGMGAFVAEEVVKLMVRKEVPVKKARCLILGFTFKENCPDVRNTRVIDIVNELQSYHVTPVIYDPWANAAEVMHEYEITVHNELPEGKFEAVILAVAHEKFTGLDVRSLVNGTGVIYDVKGILPQEVVDGRL